MQPVFQDKIIEDALLDYFKARAHSKKIFFTPKDIFPKEKSKPLSTKIRTQRWSLSVNLLKAIEEKNNIVGSFRIDLFNKSSNNCVYEATKVIE
ncbi:hypothetical protein Metho_2687 (plasmid) [Methanomethylovorans hollandica DSM 15978]|jgi:hypothetical protein|uniref:Uncharacterized protein n=1 Tax=Methanomethylovorans hollandica (strain DSM 15978 / NBRC 107637 / DMS1) TaxID=867904 RepID=L0KZH9_METHD|nr:hypothetical protein [Methanomethylovorans hollandica]AGB50817.1 hypothetical protein Metho_2687 [Methanomethylovorans hollandica DSM 15978]